MYAPLAKHKKESDNFLSPNSFEGPTLDFKETNSLSLSL
jgi:hypothetical protein